MKKALQKYLSHFERLQDNKIDDLLSTVSENFIFEDPFQKIKGKTQFKTLLKRMFKRLKKPKFKIIMVYEHKLVNVVKWNFSCEFLKKTISFSGMSEIYIKEKLITKHIDYWDSMTQLIIHLPYVGSLVKTFLKSVFKFNNI